MEALGEKEVWLSKLEQRNLCGSLEDAAGRAYRGSLNSTIP